MKIKILSVLGFLCLLLQLSTGEAAFYDPQYDVRTVKTEHFYIHYPRQVAPVAKDLLEIVEPIHVTLSEKYNWKPAGRTHVVLVDKTDSANGMATVIPANYLLLYVTPPDADSSLDHYKNYLELLFIHEYTHIIHIDQHYRVADPFHWIFGKVVAPNGLTPGWMREGIAAYEETVQTGAGRGNGSYSEMLVRTNILENTFPKIDEVAGLSLKWPGSNSQYVYGVKFFMWLADKYGEDRITKYTEEYASGLWLFSLNNKARRVWGKSFYQLWDEWQQDLVAKYTPERERLSSEGLTPLEDLLSHEDQMGYPLPHPSGEGYAYVRLSTDEENKVIVDRPGVKPVTLKRTANGQLAFSRDNASQLAYSATAGVESFHAFSEVFVYDFTKNNIRRLSEKGELKKSLRASDPDFAPMDGGKRWIVMVRTELGTDNLYVFDMATRKGYYLTDAAKYTQFSNPRFSPDGETIAVSRRENNGNRDIVLFTKTGQFIRNLTEDAASDNHPAWSPNGRYVYFTSDKTGINNIHRVEMTGGAAARVTNVLTGVFQPQIAPDGRSMLVSHYRSQGFDLKRISLDGALLTSEVSDDLGRPSVIVASAADNTSPFAGSRIQLSNVLDDWNESSARIANLEDVPASIPTAVSSPFTFGNAHTADEAVDLASPEVLADRKAAAEAPTVAASDSAYEASLQGKTAPSYPDEDLSGSYKYSAFPQILVPRYIVPTFATLDDSFLFGFATGRFDPLYRHSWMLATNYRTDNAFVGGSFVYSYTRYVPTFSAGFNRYSLNWGNLFGNGQNFYEQRHQAFVGMSVPWKRHNFGVSYFYEDRSNQSAIPAGFTLATLDRYAGFHLSYSYGRFKEFADSISRENGPFIRTDVDVTNSMFGSAEVNEQVVLTSDVRYYFEMPWSDHHVFALRAAGGFAWGDREFSGAFRFGGPFGEGNMAGYSSRLFPFRGLPGVSFAGDRALLFSAEYRFPLVEIERGAGTWPIYLRKLHLAFFTDYGDIWARGGKDNTGFFDNFMLGVGGELRGDFVLGYGLPVTARAGYAIVATNRSRVSGLEDTNFGMDSKYGNFYLQFGTSF